MKFTRITDPTEYEIESYQSGRFKISCARYAFGQMRIQLIYNHPNRDYGELY